MDEIRKAFGKRVRCLRLRRGLTQEMLAWEVDLSPEMISNIERGRHAPDFSRLGLFAGALGVAIEELFRFPIGTQVADGENE